MADEEEGAGAAVAEVPENVAAVSDDGKPEETPPISDELKTRSEWAKITRAQQTLAQREKEIERRTQDSAGLDDAIKTLRENPTLAEALKSGDREAIRRALEPDSEIDEKIAQFRKDGDVVGEVLHPLHGKLKSVEQRLAQTGAVIARLEQREQKMIAKEVNRQLGEIEKRYETDGLKDVFDRRKVLETLANMPDDIELEEDTVQRVADSLFLDKVLEAQRVKKAEGKVAEKRKDAATPSPRHADAAEAAKKVSKEDENERIYAKLREKGYTI